MENAPVRGALGEPRCNLPGDLQSFGNRQPRTGLGLPGSVLTHPAGTHLVPQGYALVERHGDEQGAVRSFVDIVDHYDVGVI